MFSYYNMIYMVISSMFISGIVVFCSMRKHLLLTLLSLEYLSLLIYLILINVLMMNMGEMFLVLTFLTFFVCEGVLGLSILVGLIRSYGNDHVNGLFMTW